MSASPPSRGPLPLDASPDWELAPLPADHGRERAQATARLAETGRSASAELARALPPIAGVQSASDAGDALGSLDSASLWRPEEAERQQWFADRLQLLKVRTGLVGAVGVLGLGVGLLVLGAYGSSFFRWLTSLWLGTGAQWIHVPESAFVQSSESRIPTLLQFAFFAVGVLGVSALSRDALNAWQRKAWAGLLAGIGGLMLFIQVTEGHALSERKQLQAALVAKSWDEADTLIARASPDAQLYLRAQVALRTSDKARLAEGGGKLLAEFDALLLRQPYADALAVSARMRKVADFRPSVLHEIDVALNGAPRSEVALDYAKRQKSGESPDKSRAITGAKVILGLAAGLGLVGLATALLVLWRRMAKRARWLTPWIAPAD